MANEASPPHKHWVPVAPESLRLGMVLKGPLLDAQGRLLLAQNQQIDTPKLLAGLKLHSALYTDISGSHMSQQAVLVGFERANRLDTPLKDLDQHVNSVVDEVFHPTETATRPEATLDETWHNLEARLRAAIGNLRSGAEPAREAILRFHELAQVIAQQLQQERDASLLLLTHRAVIDFTEYSTLHALLCAALTHDVVHRMLPASPHQRTLVLAALTMNAASKALQDQMAAQRTPATQGQLLEVDAHPRESARWLQKAGVTDPIWLTVVARHHDDLPPGLRLKDRPEVEQLIHVLEVVDRYTAALSPRGSRPGRDGRAAVKSVIRQPGSTEHDEVALDLMQHVGLFPPGSFVELGRGDLALVLKQGRHPNEPWVAPVVNRHGEPVWELKAVSVGQAPLNIVRGVSGSDIKTRCSETSLLKALHGIKGFKA